MGTPGEGYAGQGGDDQWGAGAGAPPPPSPPPRNGMGIAALVLGILAILFCWTAVGGIVFGILAIVFGVLGAGRARRGQATNRGVAVGGVVTGVLGLIVGVVFAVIFVVAGVFFTSGGGQGLVQQARECLQQQTARGASPQQAQQTCQQQLQQQVQQQGGYGQ